MCVLDVDKSTTTQNGIQKILHAHVNLKLQPTKIMIVKETDRQTDRESGSGNEERKC